MRSLQASEHEIQQLIINFLKYHGWYVQRLNSGRMPYEYGGRKKFMMLADKGTPDVFSFKATPDGMRVLFVEVKRPGKLPTPLQEAKMEELRGYGAECVVATSIEDLERQIDL